jgi:putative transposase
MAELERMTAGEVVGHLLEDEAGADLVRDSLRWLVQQLMEVEVSELIGAAHGERTDDRATWRNGYRPRRWETRAGELELRIPKPRQGSYFPSFLEPRGEASGRCSRWSSRPTCARPRPAASTSWSSRSGCGSRAPRCRGSAESSTSRSRPSASARSTATTPTCGSTPRSRRSETGAGWSAKAVVIAYGVHETGRREILGFDVGEAETEAFWREFLGSLIARGLSGVQLVVSDAHAGSRRRPPGCFAAPGSAAACTSSAIAAAMPARTSAGSWPR